MSLSGIDSRWRSRLWHWCAEAARSHRFVVGALCACAAVLFFAVPAADAALVPVLKADAPPPEVDTTVFASLLVIDAASGKTLYAMQPAKPWTPASLTKLMTAHVFVSKPRNWTSKGNILRVDEVGGGRLGVVSGSTMTLQDLLNAAIVGSANNAAMALARLSGFGSEGFITAMNAEAQRMGLTNTSFHEAAGMDAANTATAYDLAVLFRAAQTEPHVNKAMTTDRYQFTVATPSPVAKDIKNTNLLLFGNPDIRVTGGKTGYLVESQYNFGLSAKPGAGMPANAGEVIVMVLGAPSRDSSQEAAATLARWAWTSFDWRAAGALPVLFSRTLALGDRGADVRALQKYLNERGTPVAASGPGASGRETELFGPLTKAALARFQEAHAEEILKPQGRASSTGAMDMGTRAYLNGSGAVPAGKALSPLQRFPRVLSLGAMGNDVRELQIYLNAHGAVIASSGPGAPGQETSYFGPLTQQALARFQQAHATEIAANGGPVVAFGELGDSTRRFLGTDG